MRTLSLLIGAIVIVSTAPSLAGDRECVDTGAETGVCGGIGDNGSSVDLDATQEGPSTPDGDSPPSDSSDSSGNEGGAAPGSSVPAPDGSGLGGNPRLIRDTLGECIGAECGPDADPTPTITLTDLARFAPATPSIRMEPEGWIVRDLPANFIADVTTNQHSGTLLDRPVDVRFSPVSYSWNWGDGTTATFTTPGNRWDDLGVRRFTETTTSHVFTERGTVSITLQVGYAVDYRFANGAWTTVTGTVTANTTIDARVITAKTVLVRGYCTTDSDAPGC